MRSVATVLEKGGERRIFDLDARLADALRGAIRVNRGSPYVFPANRGIGPRPPSQNDAWLHRLCARCDPPIVGPHVHVHALRRTTISMLFAATPTRKKKGVTAVPLDAGNSLEMVSQWIGHHSPAITRTCIGHDASSATTNIYWEKCPLALTNNMCIPWIHPSDTADPVAALIERTKVLEQRLRRLQSPQP